MLKKTFIAVTTTIFLLTMFFAVQPEIYAQKDKKDRKEAEKLFNQGNALFRQRDFKAAINNYAQAISLYPGYSNAHYWKGTAHSNLNEADQAVDDLTLALQYGYKPLEVYKIRWLMYYQKQQYDEAFKDAEAGLKLLPDDTLFQLALGDIYRKKKDCENAVTYYEKVASKESENADLPYNLAVCYGELGRYEKQQAAAQEAIQKGTKFPGAAWALLGDALIKQKQFDKAIEAYERSLTADDKLYETYTVLAETYRYRGSFKNAILTLEKGLINFENDGNFLVNLTWYHSLAGNKGEAVREGLKAIQFAKENPMAFTNLCRAYSDSELHQQALNTCQEALKKIRPGDNVEGEIHYNMGRAYNGLKQTEKAVAEYTQAVEGLKSSTSQSPDNADGFYLLGNSYYGTKQYDEAIKAYQEAINKSPLFAPSYFNQASAYLEKKDKESARLVYDKLKEIDPKLAERLLKAINSK